MVLNVKLGLDKRKVDVAPASRDNYTIMDNRDISMEEWYYRYSKWDIIQEIDTILTGDMEVCADSGSFSIQLGDSEHWYFVVMNIERIPNITINGDDYYGGSYTLGSGGNQTITFDGGRMTLCFLM